MGRGISRGWGRVRILAQGCALLLALSFSAALAQQPTLHIRSTLVLVPTLVETKAGEPVFTLGAKDFLLRDNGIEQKISVDAESDKAPISIVVLVQVGGSAAREFDKFQGLPTMVEALAGDTRHRVAVVEFDSQPRLIEDFTNDPEGVQTALSAIRPGDGGAAILDAVWYAVDMLNDQPKENQRVLLLLSETRDHGSRTPIREVIRKIGRSNVVVYSLAFSPARGDLFDFSNIGGDADLLAPLRMAIAALRKNSAAAIPRMTGGEYFRFNHGKQLDREMAALANQVHNRYILSFQPTDPAPGLHLLKVGLKASLDARVLARSNYWAANPATVSEPEIQAPSAPRD